MIRVTVELLPFGFEEGRKTLAEMDIYNDGTGSTDRGNYGVRSYRKGTDKVLREAKVLDWSRLSKPVLSLVCKALEELGY